MGFNSILRFCHLIAQGRKNLTLTALPMKRILIKRFKTSSLDRNNAGETSAARPLPCRWAAVGSGELGFYKTIAPYPNPHK